MYPPFKNRGISDAIKGHVSTFKKKTIHLKKKNLQKQGRPPELAFRNSKAFVMNHNYELKLWDFNWTIQRCLQVEIKHSLCLPYRLKGWTQLLTFVTLSNTPSENRALVEYGGFDFGRNSEDIQYKCTCLFVLNNSLLFRWSADKVHAKER